MARRLNTTCDFFDTIEEANEFKKQYDKKYRHREPACVTPWSNAKGTEHKFVCWYQY